MTNDLGAKQLAAHLRTFCDYLVLEFSKSSGGGHVTKAIDATNTMIWKYNVITLDRYDSVCVCVSRILTTLPLSYDAP